MLLRSFQTFSTLILITLMLCRSLALCQTPANTQLLGNLPKSALRPNLTVEQVVDELQKRNVARAAALVRYEGTRVYRMQYRGFPHDYDAEMVVHVAYAAPNSKTFTVV